MNSNSALWKFHSPEKNQNNEVHWKVHGFSFKQPIDFVSNISTDSNQNTIVTWYSSITCFSHKGKVLWEKTTDKDFLESDFFNCQQGCFTSDGNFVCAVGHCIFVFDKNGKFITKKDIIDNPNVEHVNINICSDSRNGNILVAICGEFNDVQILDKNLNLVFHANSFHNPWAVAVDGNGNFVVLDLRERGPNDLIFFSEKGEFQCTIDVVSRANYIAVDFDGNLLITSDEDKIQYYKWS